MLCSHRWSRNFFCVVVPTIMLVGCVAVAPKEEIPAEPVATQTEEELKTHQVQQEFEAALHAMKSGNHARAKELFLAMSGTYPEYSGPWVNLGILHERKGELEEAESAYKKAIEANAKNPEAFNQLAIFYRNQGKFDDALLIYRQGIKHHSDYAKLHRNIGILYDLYLGQIEKALPHYQAYLKINPDDKQVETWLADILQRLAR